MSSIARPADATAQVAFYVTPEERDELDSAAKAHGMTRTALLRAVVVATLEHERSQG